MVSPGMRDRRLVMGNGEERPSRIPKQVHFSHWDYLFTHLLKSGWVPFCCCVSWFPRTPPGHIKKKKNTKKRKSSTLSFMLGFIKINYEKNIRCDILFLSH